jgi:hypothetical protein
MADNSSTNDDTTWTNVEVPIPRKIRFWLMIIFDIPAVVCTLFLLYNLFVNRTLRQSLNNHSIIVLLIIVLMSDVIDIPSYISFVYLGYVWLSTPSFCFFWWFVDIGLFDMIAILMAFATIERHILVFHSGWISTRRKRFFVHYIPLTLVIIYDILFYIYVLFFPPCENVFDYTQSWCSYPCYYDNQIVAMYDTIVNCIFPTSLIVIFSILLLVRYIRQKRRFQQAIQWRKCRKMVIQLLLISNLYLIFYLPLLSLMTLHLCGLPSEIGANAELYAYFFSYFISLLSPYVCLASLPELWRKIKIHPTQWLKIQQQHNNAVTLMVNHKK